MNYYSSDRYANKGQFIHPDVVFDLVTFVLLLIGGRFWALMR
jgi:hypothetical protein